MTRKIHSLGVIFTHTERCYLSPKISAMIHNCKSCVFRYFAVTKAQLQCHFVSSFVVLVHLRGAFSTVVKGGGGGGGLLIPFPRKLFFSNPTSPACVAQIEIPFPFFYYFFFHESQSQCTKSHFPASKKGRSQLPFYPFTTLFLDRGSIFVFYDDILVFIITLMISVVLFN